MMHGDADSSSRLILFGNVPDAVTDSVRELILTGKLAAGDRVSQTELAEYLGVSTMPVREALRRLEAEGLIVFQPRQGAHVRQLSLAEFDEIFRIREELEILALSWVVQDVGAIPLDKLRKLLDDLIESENIRDIDWRLNCVRDFYFTIFAVSQKEILLRLIANLWDRSVQYLRAYSEIDGIVVTRVEHIRNIYGACEARNAEELIRLWRRGYSLIREILLPRLEAEALQGGQ